VKNDYQCLECALRCTEEELNVESSRGGKGITHHYVCPVCGGQVALVETRDISIEELV
jgi:transcription initiation factor IIE alpha subunit